ncbi:MAG: DUF1552 domain-containing protein [Verrucomicrobia bacterium]|nr:DUF1552 domain-containing protein [Verrucomicrobiota bacterium]
MTFLHRTRPISRRTLLRGAGVSLSLPLLEAMGPLSAASAPAPACLGFVYLPNGVVMDGWRPLNGGSSFDPGDTLAPLHPFRESLQVFGGLDHRRAEANGDGGGDHARANATFLTGCQAKKTAGNDIEVGVSVDQIAAARVRGSTPLDSLELGCDPSRKAGRCDSGYSCAYQFNFAWRTPSLPLPPEVDPRVVFEKLFGGGVLGEDPAARRQRMVSHQSLLDFVAAEARDLQARLGAEDRGKLDEYLSGVRELERKIENAERFTRSLPEAGAPTGIPESYQAHIRIMYDLMVLAFQTGSTRIATFLVAHDGSNRSFPEAGVADGHHYLSHHGNDLAKIEKLRKIDRFYVEQFAYFLGRLQGVREGAGSLLDRVMIVFGGGHSDGNLHSHTDLPVVLAGRGGGLNAGRHVHHRGKPMTNLYVSLLDRFGAKVDRVGDSTGPLGDV